jgi:ribonuclease-3
VRVGDTLHGNGVGRSKKEAEQAAAETAYSDILERLGLPGMTAGGPVSSRD